MSLLRTHMPTGPLIVGCCDVMIGCSKEGSLMRLFYPTQAKTLPLDEKLWTQWYLGDQYSQGLARFSMPRILQGIVAKLFSWQTRGSVVPSVWCGPVLAQCNPLPVVVFSHGLGANRSMYSSVCSQLASHGYLVAALEHRDGSACSSFTLDEGGEKKWVDFEPLAPGEKEFTLRNRQLATRVRECRATLTVLERINAGGEVNQLESEFQLQQLVGRMDLSRPIMAGHSFGGCSAIATMHQDARFKLGVALDPWLFPLKDAASEVCPGVTQPTLCISTEAFQTKQNLQAMNTLPTDTAVFVTIKGTVHQNQVDTPFLLGAGGRLVAGTASALDPATAMNINNAIMMAFIHAHHGLPKEHCKGFSERWDQYLEDHKDKIVNGLHGKADKMIGWNGFVRV